MGFGKRIPNLVVVLDSEKGAEFRVQCEVEMKDLDQAAVLLKQLRSGSKKQLGEAKDTIGKIVGGFKAKPKRGKATLRFQADLEERVRGEYQGGAQAVAGAQCPAAPYLRHGYHDTCRWRIPRRALRGRASSGSGGMGRVYLARDRRHDRLVAVKVLDPEYARTLGTERFIREIHIAAQLTHQSIVPVYDSGEVDGQLFYVMPYVEGESLRQRLLRDTMLPLEQALTWAREVCDALTFAHTHGILHRDIKPENLLIQGEHILLADLGSLEPSTLRPGRESPAGNSSRNTCLHEPGTGQWRATRCDQRSLLARLRGLRDAGRRAAIFGHLTPGPHSEEGERPVRVAQGRASDSTRSCG